MDEAFIGLFLQVVEMIFRDALTYCLKSIGFHKIDLSSYADKTIKAMVRSIQVMRNSELKFRFNSKKSYLLLAHWAIYRRRFYGKIKNK